MVALTSLARSIRSLEELPGIGKKVRDKLVDYFGDSSAALEAIAAGRLSQLAEAVGRVTAARIIHGLYKAVTGKWPRDVAATNESWELFLKAREVIEKRVASQAGKDVLRCMLPMPSKGIQFIEDRLEKVVKIVDLLREGKLNVKRLKELLRNLRWPKPVKLEKLNRTLIVVNDYKAFEEAKQKLAGIVNVVFVEVGEEVERVAAEVGESVVYDPYNLYRGMLPRVSRIEVEEVAPELIVEYFRVNWDVVETVLSIFENFKDVLVRLFRIMKVDVDIETIVKKLGIARYLRGGDISPDIDPEYSRLYNALKNLDKIIDEVEEWLNNLIQSKLESLEVRLSAAQFLKLLQVLREGATESIELPEEIHEVFEEAAITAEKLVVEKLRLYSDEAELIKGFVPRTPSFPIEIDRSRIEDLKALLKAKLYAKRFEILQEMATQLKDVKDGFEKAVDALAYLDVLLSMAELIIEGKATIPDVSVEYLGVGFVEGLEVDLLERPDAQPVNYVVGETPYKPDGVKGERVILLTGANSGGKTTLLKTICETVLLAQAGLTVFAKKAWVGAFDEVHFFSKPSGMVDAGALESTLKTLARIAAGKGEARRLILVDELEAATEAGAAARIMAVLISTLCSGKGVVAVIVSHLAREILECLEQPLEGCLRIDGIEAKGLDERHNLIVDRNPRYYHLASSTPELVVRRLLYKTRDKHMRIFFQKVLEALTQRRA